MRIQFDLKKRKKDEKQVRRIDWDFRLMEVKEHREGARKSLNKDRQSLRVKKSSCGTRQGDICGRSLMESITMCRKPQRANATRIASVHLWLSYVKDTYR